MGCWCASTPMYIPLTHSSPSYPIGQTQPLSASQTAFPVQRHTSAQSCPNVPTGQATRTKTRHETSHNFVNMAVLTKSHYFKQMLVNVC